MGTENRDSCPQIDSAEREGYVGAHRSYLRKNQKELIERIRRGKYTPDPVRRVGIPKPEGGVRKLGIPTVKDRMFQQAIGQQLMPIYEPLF